MTCRRCKRPATHRDPVSGELNRLCEMHFGYACDAEDHEISQRWIRNEKARNPRWQPPPGRDEP